jgi:hypothetical protein
LVNCVSAKKKKIIYIIFIFLDYFDVII